VGPRTPAEKDPARFSRNTRDFSGLPQDVVGTVFERLIPPGERHSLGQYFNWSEHIAEAGPLTEVRFDTTHAHVVGLFGKRGSGKSYRRPTGWKMETGWDRNRGRSNEDAADYLNLERAS
jgi:hypothetical protein